MKFSKTSQLILVSMIGLMVATWLTGCEIVTADFLYVASYSSTDTAGVIQSFAVDADSGALRTASSSVSLTGLDPVSLAVSPDYKYLFAAAQNPSSTGGSIVSYTIALNGVLTSNKSLTLTDTPKAIAVNAAGTYLYVISGTSTVTLSEYAITSGSIASAPTASKTISIGSDVVAPEGVAVLANGDAVYAAVADTTAGNGYVYGYIIGSDGALTASANSPYSAGVRPSGIAADPSSAYVYVTDYASSQLIGYRVVNSTTLSYLTAGPFSSGKQPTGVAIDPRGRFLYVSNALDNTVTAYAITTETGVPSSVSGTSSTSNPTDTYPVAITVEPAYGRYVYTGNSLGKSVSGFKLNSTSGALTTTQATPYNTTYAPTAVLAVPHGNHASITPVD